MLNTTQTPNFGQLFDLYLDMNEIEVVGIKEVEEVKKIILSQKYNNVLTFHRYGFIFYYFDQLVKGEISHEQFLTMGDVEGQIEDQINPHIYREEHPVYLTTLTPELVSQWKDNDLVIVDKLLYDYYVSQYSEVNSEAKLVVLN